MRDFVRFGIMAAAVAMALGAGAAAGLAQDKEAVIKQRQATMKQQGEDVKAIQAFIKGEGDQATAAAKATDLLGTSARLLDLFPEGTSLAEFPGKTAAKPEIWQQWDKFKTVPPALHGEVEKLVEAIKTGNKQSVADQLAATGKNGCGACHGTYREKTS